MGLSSCRDVCISGKKLWDHCQEKVHRLMSFHKTFFFFFPCGCLIRFYIDYFFFLSVSKKKLINKVLVADLSGKFQLQWNTSRNRPYNLLLRWFKVILELGLNILLTSCYAESSKPIYIYLLVSIFPFHNF